MADHCRPIDYRTEEDRPICQPVLPELGYGVVKVSATVLQPDFGAVKGACAHVGPWNTVIVALVKVTSVMVAVQLLLGQPPCFPVIGPGSPVLAQKLRLPFLMSPDEMGSAPVTVIAPGF